MKKIIMASLCMITLNGFAGIDYQTKAECQADIQHYIDVSDELPVDLSMDYWQWFEAFLRSESKKTSACEETICPYKDCSYGQTVRGSKGGGGHKWFH